MTPRRTPSRLPLPLYIAAASALCMAAAAPAGAQEPSPARPPAKQASAQRASRLEGTYTVNPDGQGDRNFKSITAAVRSLARRGVSGSVKLVVAPGTYQEAVVLGPIRGVDEDNQVTFQGAVKGKVVWNGKKVPKQPEKKKAKGKKSLFWAAVEAAGFKKKKPRAGRGAPPDENTTIALGEGTEHLVFDGLVFEKTAGGAAIFGNPGASHIEIKNCRFGEGIKGHRGREGVIYVRGASKSVGWQIHHCVFELPSIRSGLYFSQVKQFRIQDNHIKLNGTSSGMYLINENKAKNRIERNLFTGKTGGGNGGCAINIALSNLNNDVANNTIIIDTNGHAIRTFGTKTNFNRIYGNLIVVTGGGAGIHVNSGTLNHFESDGNLFFIESNNIGTWDNGLHAGMAEWREATGVGPRGTADEGSCLGDAEMIETVSQLMLKPQADPKARLKKVLLLLGTGDEAGKRLAARTCIQMGESARVAIPHLALLCHHRSAGVRADAARALGALGNGASIAIPELLKLLDDDNHLVVMRAAATLANFGRLAQKAAPKLVELTKRDTDDGSDELQKVSLAALRKIEPENPMLK